MENVTISKICGLCAGCNHAITSAEQQLEKGNKIALFKEIVHNNTVNTMLKNKGIKIKDNLEDLSIDEVVILRAHGEPPETYKFLEKNNIKYIDCTCQNVKKIHNKVNEYSNLGYNIIIIGKYGKTTGKPHPEIQGTIGWCNKKEILIEDEDDLIKLKNYKNEKFYLTCQTTFNIEKTDILINQIQEILKPNNEIIINKSICPSPYIINENAVALAKQVDLMIVIGSKSSSNATELSNNIKKFTKTIFTDDIENIENILKDNNIVMHKNIKIGLTAGASTLKSELAKLKEKLQSLIDNL